jgi:tRNA(His) guanylyltransferase
MSELVLESNFDYTNMTKSDDINLDIINLDNSLSNTNNPNSETNPNLAKKLSDRMKQYEAEMDFRIKPCEAFLVRLDGRAFSKFTKKFIKPFDIVFVKAMCKTLVDLVKEFDVQTGYTHSDEITLIFDSKCSNDQYKSTLDGTIDKKDIRIHMFDGRVQKILTLLSSFCSVRFNYHLDWLIDLVADKYDDKFVELIKSHSQIFDARILKFDNVIRYEILNHQIWRSIHDCERNAISTYAYTYFGHKKINKMNCSQMIKLLEEKNIFWSKDIPLFIKHGIYCKKILVEKEIGENKVLRSEFVCKQLKINFSHDNLSMLLDKYWTNPDGKLDIDNITL